MTLDYLVRQSLPTILFLCIKNVLSNFIQSLESTSQIPSTPPKYSYFDWDLNDFKTQVK